jgi:hypothetical protein
MSSDANRPLGLLFKVYVWSIILEPLLFFVLGHRAETGVTANISRLLQFCVVTSLLFSFVTQTFPLRRVHPLNRLYAYYSAYFLAACASGLYGYFTGTYKVSVAYHGDVSGFTAVLNSAWLRPLFEYGIALYYFVYFAVLPQFFLTSRERLQYFFRAFFFMFNATLVLGFVDVLLARAGFVFIGRHLFDWIAVGGRFHGLAGEPRDAFVYLIFGIAVYFLRCYLTQTRPKRWWIGVVALAALLTQSASGLIGVAIFLGLLVTIGFIRLNRSAAIGGVVAVFVVVPLLFLVIVNTERLKAYMDVLLIIFDILDRHEGIPPILTGQVNNIYPVYYMIAKLRDFEFLPLLIGFGFGSASAINNLMGTFDELANPNSQLIRLLFESGLIGSALFVLAFYRPMELLTAGMPRHDRRRFLVITLLLVGAFLGHRNASLFIFLGLAIATLQAAYVRRRVEPTARTPSRYSALPAAGR